MNKPWLPLIWISIFAIVLIWSGINPVDYYTWALEVPPPSSLSQYSLSPAQGFP